MSDPASDPMAPIRAEVMAQAEPDRLDYALDLLEWYLAPVPAFYTAAADLGLTLCAADVRILWALERERGRFVSLDRLLAARCIDRAPDGWQSIERIPRSLAAIRGELARLGLPVEIEGRREIGYRLTAPDGFSLLNVRAAA